MRRCDARSTARTSRSIRSDAWANLPPVRMKVAQRILLLLSLAWSSSQAQSYFKVIGQVGRNEAGFVAHRAPTGEVYIGGSVNDSALVQRIDVDGNVMWSRAFKPPGQYSKVVVHLESTSDGSLIGCGSGYVPTGEPVEGFHFRMDPSGNMVWVRYWDDPLVYERRIIELNATEYIVFGGNFDATTPNYSDILTARVDAASGDVIWLSGLVDQYSPVPYISDMVSASRIGASFYASCNIFTDGSALSTRRVGLAKFDATGQHLQTQYLLYPNTDSRRMVSSDVIAVNDSLTIAYFGDINGASTNFSQGLIRLDTLGNIIWARDYNIGGSAMEQNTRVVPAPFGYVVAGRLMSTSPTRLFLMAISHGGLHLWTRTYGPATQAQTLTNLYASNLIDMGDGFLLTGTVDQGGGETDLLLIRTDLDGNVDCAEVTPRNALTTILPEFTFPSPTIETPFLAGLGSEPTVVDDALITNECVLGIDLGPDTISCDTVLLDPGVVQGATYEWQDGSTDQTFDASESGTYWVRVSVDCCIATDTIEVEITALTSFYLGNDTTVCGEDGITLVAPAGSWTAEWSDGSSGSELLVQESGTYWLTLSGGDCAVSDTIAIEVIPLPAATITGDTVSCDGTAVQLEALVANADDFVWSDASTDPALEVPESEEVWLQATNQCGTVGDTVQVVVAGPIELDFGPDTVLCAGGSLTLVADFPGWSVLWSDGSTGTEVVVTGPGTYWAEVSVAECLVRDTIEVDLLSPPLAVLGPDTTVCGGVDLLLQPVLTDAGSVLWSDGSLGEELIVTTSGTYSVTATNSCGSASDAIDVVMVPALDVGIGADTLLCEGDTLVFDLSGADFDLLWQDSLSGPLFTVIEEGTYWVQGTSSGCVERDTIEVAYTRLALLDLGPDTVLCEVDSLVLDAGEEGVEAVWQNGITGRYFEALRTAWYVARITNYCGTSTDSIRVSFAIPPDPLDTVDLCPGRTVELDPGGEMLWTRWTTNEITPTIVVGEGEYGYVAEDIHGCPHRDSTVVRISADKDGIVYLPNSFTPDQDGYNDVFLPVGAERGDFALTLFDRWGRELYRTNDPYKGWDGTSGGAITPPGAYIWTMTYRDRCDGSETEVSTIGHVILVR